MRVKESEIEAMEFVKQLASMMATGCKENRKEVQAAVLFIHYLGDETLEVLETLDLTADGKAHRNKIMKQLDVYFLPRTDHSVKTHVFNSKNKLYGKTIGNFLAAFEKIARDCEFGTLEDRLIKDRKVSGIRHQKVEDRLLRETYLDLSKTIEICRVAEQMENYVKGMRDKTENFEVQVAWEVSLQKHENLLIADRKIYDTLLQEDVSEEDLMVEIDSCEGYDKNIIDMRFTYGNRQKHVDIGLDGDDRRSRASLAVSESTLGPVPGAQSENNGGANPESSTMSRLVSLMSFVKSEVENKERISLAAEGFGLNSDNGSRTATENGDDSSTEWKHNRAEQHKHVYKPKRDIAVKSSREKKTKYYERRVGENESNPVEFEEKIFAKYKWEPCIQWY
ncbi:hypothetical protein JTB14_037408 [Gonioctena quinquepunctata]|nr:hypothetical protein JTB14_037408 [Gonioctena quinquepunctata]